MLLQLLQEVKYFICRKELDKLRQTSTDKRLIAVCGPMYGLVEIIFVNDISNAKVLSHTVDQFRAVEVIVQQYKGSDNQIKVRAVLFVIWLLSCGPCTELLLKLYIRCVSELKFGCRFHASRMAGKTTTLWQNLTHPII